MITFGLGTSGTAASFEQVAVGDTFAKIEYQRHGCGIQSVIAYAVMKAGKRDIVCHSQNNRAITINRKHIEYSCYPVDSAKISDAKKELELQNRRVACANILESRRRIHEHFDEQFMTAIEEFGARLEKAKSCAG